MVIGESSGCIDDISTNSYAGGQRPTTVHGTNVHRNILQLQIRAWLALPSDEQD